MYSVNEQFILNETNLCHWRDQQWSWDTVENPVMFLWYWFEVLSVKLTQLTAENSSTLNIGVTSFRSGLWFTGLPSFTWNQQWLQTFFCSIFLMETFCSSPAEPLCERGTCCIRSNLHAQFAVKCFSRVWSHFCLLFFFAAQVFIFAAQSVNLPALQ